MRSSILFIAVFIAILSSCAIKSRVHDRIKIDMARKGNIISPSMYGIFFEEINHSGDGGLYPELVSNRGFEASEIPEGYTTDGHAVWPPQLSNHITGKVNATTYKWHSDPIPGWKLESEGMEKATMSLSKDYPLFNTAANSLLITLPLKAGKVALINEGYWGMGVRQNDEYDLRFYIKDNDFNGSLNVQLLSSSNELLEFRRVELKKSIQWCEYKTTLKPGKTDSNARLVLSFEGVGKVWVEYVSLFPRKTFKNRPNGLRIDAAKFLEDLRPAFIRWPGGCIVEGISLANRYQWKKTLGDPVARSGEYDMWGYHNTYGFGYHEFLQFCEDIKADAMFVCNIGIGCQARMGDACSEQDVDYYIQDVMDAIEYAIGDSSTLWGSKRVQAGHQTPFPLKYIEVGNENFGDLYNKRFDVFYTAIKKKYPQLTIISDHGLGDDVKNIAKTDMIDPHWYVTPDYFFKNATIFDSIPRTEHKVYVGEYACNQGVGSGNMLAALSEAAFITGMERNSDLVKMASYAPLLQNKNDRAWPVNLIWIDNMQVVGRSSYYVQKMTSENRPTYNLQTTTTHRKEVVKLFADGSIGVGSWATKVLYKDVRISFGNRKEEQVSPKIGIVKSGDWSVTDTLIAQNSLDDMTGLFVDKSIHGNYTIELKARKTGGNEGFLIYFGMNNNNNDGYLFNVGGWGNTLAGLEEVKNGVATQVISKQVNYKVEINKWYTIKIIRKHNNLEFWVDGIQILDYTPIRIDKRFIVSGYDELTKEIVLKVVNANNRDWRPAIRIESATKIDAGGKVVVMSSISPEDENSFDQPKKIFPKESRISGLSKSFKYKFLPFSYTIMRIKVME